jgi:SAM-dependent methyltransferase
VTLLGARSQEPELLDGEDLSRHALSRSLSFVTEVNRGIGVVRGLRRHLRGLVGRTGVRLLDVGTGSGQVLEDLLGWGRARGGRNWEGVGVDLRKEMLDVAAAADRGAGPAPRYVRGDALALPFRDAAFDAVFSTLTLHHFSDDQAVVLVSEMARVSRDRVVVCDLERCLPAYLCARVLAATRWRDDPLTRHDGPLSVRRAFTPEELRAIGQRAGLGGARIVRRFPSWIAIVGGRP